MKRFNFGLDKMLGRDGFEFYIIPTIHIHYSSNEFLKKYEFLGWKKIIFKWLFWQVSFCWQNK